MKCYVFPSCFYARFTTREACLHVLPNTLQENVQRLTHDESDSLSFLPLNFHCRQAVFERTSTVQFMQNK